MGYINTRPIDGKLKSQPRLWNDSQQSNLLIKDKQMIIIHVWRKEKKEQI